MKEPKILDITREPADILQKKLERVFDITPEINELIEDMRKTMINAPGIGIAANQVGRDLLIFLVDTEIAGKAEDEDISDKPTVYINPEITEYSKDTDVMQEGCLSIPDYWADIERSKKVKIKALDEKGNKIRFRAKGMLARVLQHEFDHLQGILIKDRVIQKK